MLRFTGAIDNPTLDILAIRPNLTQRVGVQITGTALLPRVRLYAQPELPDAEKLSWLVVGRSSASGGAEAALLQQAALARLGSKGGGGMSGGLAALAGAGRAVLPRRIEQHRRQHHRKRRHPGQTLFAQLLRRL